MEVQELLDEIIAFRDERDWEQFHTPHQLAAALSIEASELQELFLWKEAGEVEEALKESDTHKKARLEIADVLIFALLFCDSIGADPAVVIKSKLAENTKKYPTEKARGRADKYTDLSQPNSSDE